MALDWELAVLYVLAYLLGSLPTAYILGRVVKGIDLRRYGSGNVGAANVGEQIGKGWMIPQLLLDMAGKGAAPVWLGMYWLGLQSDSWSLLGASLLAVAGHNWSPFLKFQGGRGIAVLGGGLVALSLPMFAFASLVTFGGYAVIRSMGVWVLLALILLPVATLTLGEAVGLSWYPQWAGVPGQASNLSWYSVLLLGLVILKRLLANWTPLPSDLPRRQVLLNRLFRDREARATINRC